jgi:hypothetical protein
MRATKGHFECTRLEQRLAKGTTTVLAGIAKGNSMHRARFDVREQEDGRVKAFAKTQGAEPNARDPLNLSRISGSEAFLQGASPQVPGKFLRVGRVVNQLYKATRNALSHWQIPEVLAAQRSPKIFAR